MILESKFNLTTFTYSNTADELHIDNTQITDEQLDNLQKLHLLLIETQNGISTKFGKLIPIQINSAFRSIELNKKIGGVPTSQHCYGQAADTVSVGISLDDYFDVIKTLAKTNILIFGQVILEYEKWVHISTPTDKIINQFMIKQTGKPYEHITL